MLQMYVHPLDDASHEAQRSGAAQIQANSRPHRTGHSQRSAGPCQPWRNAGIQVVLVLSDPSSLIHLAPIPAMTCFPTAPISFPWQATPRLLSQHLSWTVTAFSLYSGSIFLPRFFTTSTPSIQSLAYFLFFQLALQLPSRISGHSSPIICLLPVARPIPAPVSNINILLPQPLPPNNVMIWELREAGTCSVRTKSSEILVVKVKEVPAAHEQPVFYQS